MLPEIALRENLDSITRTTIENYINRQKLYHIMGEPTPGRYLHYKGKEYEVLFVSRNSEDPHQQLVNYRGLYEHHEYGRNAFWTRPLEMFMEEVEVNGKKVPRFKKID